MRWLPVVAVAVAVVVVVRTATHSVIATATATLPVVLLLPYATATATVCCLVYCYYLTQTSDGTWRNSCCILFIHVFTQRMLEKTRQERTRLTLSLKWHRHRSSSSRMDAEEEFLLRGDEPWIRERFTRERLALQSVPQVRCASAINFMNS